MSRDDIIYFQVTRTESNRIFQGTDSFGISHALYIWKRYIVTKAFL
jgi:hypothetical protein